MTIYLRYLLGAVWLLYSSSAYSQRASHSLERLTGAWIVETKTEKHVLLFQDGYCTFTSYIPQSNRFIQTKGGPYSHTGETITIQYEFDSQDKNNVNETKTFPLIRQPNGVRTNVTGDWQTWQPAATGQQSLDGVWKISARKQEGKLMPIHSSGTRKTIKILTGNRFQWVAIDPGTKQFMGTGGGTYTFDNGKYSELIEFFSRDSSRVGSVLTFEGSLQNGNWHHSGMSSKGDPIYEVWSRQ